MLMGRIAIFRYQCGKTIWVILLHVMLIARLLKY